MSDILNLEKSLNILSPAEAIISVDSLKSAIERNDENSIIEMLGNDKFRQTCIINRGKKSVNSELFIDSFQVVLNKLKPGTTIETIDGDTLIAMVHDEGLPEEILSDIMAAAVHVRRVPLILKLYNNFKNKKDLNPVVVGFIKHHYASWAGAEGNKGEARKVNKEIINDAMDESATNLSLRAEAGVAIYSEENDLNSDIFRDISENLQEAGDDVNALRNKQNEAIRWINKARYELKGGSKRKAYEYLDIAENIAQKSLEKAGKSKDTWHSSAKVIAFRLLSKICELKGYNKDASINRRKAHKWGKDFGYKTE